MSVPGRQILRERLDRLNEELGKHVENLVHFGVTHSTHALARQIIAEMDEESQKLGSTLILADSQEKGEGRGDRSWESPEGGLYMSWLRSGIKAETISQLPMLAAAAAHDAISRLGIPDIRIKWPNDVLVGGRKLAGILVFARHGDTTWVTVGLGVNIETTPVLDETDGLLATSIAELLGDGDSDNWRDQIVCTFVDQLDNLMNEPAPAIELWRKLLIQRPGDTVNVRLASDEVVSGTLMELTNEGFLKVKENGKERVITGGDVIES
jgi:BirA family biotin operon repressor/biotin-[acetyl-CoA-carboxylase] ligase